MKILSYAEEKMEKKRTLTENDELLERKSCKSTINTRKHAKKPEHNKNVKW